MSHYAFLDANNIVISVIVGKNEDEDSIDWEEFYGAKRTSYNTRRGKYYYSDGTLHPDQSKAFRKNYAGIGYSYDPVRDAFIPPKPEGRDSWTLNEETCVWEAPVPKPIPPEGSYQEFTWDEATLSWIPGPLEQYK